MKKNSRTDQTRNTNRQFVLSLLRSNNLLSRTQIAEKTGLSKATISRLVSEMIEHGLVEEVRTSGSGVGRPHIMLQLAPRAQYVIGVESSSSGLRTILTDQNSRLVKQRFLPLHNLSVDLIVESLANEINSLYKGFPDEQLVGIGMAVPGIVKPDTGVVTLESNLGWQDIPYANKIFEKIKKPIVLSNRTQAATWVEHWSGDSDRVTDLLYIRLGSSIESGIIIGGNLHFGSTFASGAIGHMTLDPNGITCICGNSGCLNTVVGSQALLTTTRRLLKENSTSLMMGMVDGNPAFLKLNHLLDAAKAGDGLAVRIISETGRALGIIVASLVNFLNFERIVIGGQLTSVGQDLLVPLQEEIYRRALPASLVTCQIDITKLGATAAAIGAANLLLQKLSQ